MHIYAFGSICRGEIDISSDIDLLAITTDTSNLDSLRYSIYHPKKIESFWEEGNPFAWHLFFESKLIFAGDGGDFIKKLGRPGDYTRCASDCQKFYEIFASSYRSLLENTEVEVFEMSNIFLSMRNIATCFALGMTGNPVFSRDSIYKLHGVQAPIPRDRYRIWERARLLATRGVGERLTKDEIDTAKSDIQKISGWMTNLVELSEKEKQCLI